MANQTMTSNNKVARSLVAGFGLGGLITLLWFAGQIGVAASIKDTVIAQGVGYSTFVAAPAAGVLASIIGFIAGAVSQKGRLRWWCLWTVIGFGLLFAAWIGLLLSDPGRSASPVSAALARLVPLSV